MPSELLFASYEVVQRIIQCNKSHTPGENIVPATATDNAKQLSISLCLKTKWMTAYKKMFIAKQVLCVLGCLLCS